MVKKILGASVFVTALLVPSIVFGATVTNLEFNGNVNVEGGANSTVNSTLRVVVPVGEVVEFVQTDVLGDGLSPVCHNVGDMNEGINSVTLPVKLPPNVGTYSLETKTYGVFGNITANGCVGGAEQNGTATFSSPSNVIKVISGPTTNDVPPVVGSDKPSWLDAMIAAIIAAVKPVTPPTPPVSTICQTLAAKMMGTQYGVKNNANVVLQGFLLSEGQQIPALTAGAAFGLFLDQTQAALSNYRNIKGC